jgi:hypothetical protein
MKALVVEAVRLNYSGSPTAAERDPSVSESKGMPGPDLLLPALPAGDQAINERAPAARTAASRVSTSYAPSWRRSLMKKVGVPVTPL